MNERHVKVLAQRAREALAALESRDGYASDDVDAIIDDLQAALEPFGHDWVKLRAEDLLGDNK